MSKNRFYLYLLSFVFFNFFCFAVNAYGLNRMGLEAVGLYRKMPHHLRTEATYVCVLNACSHSGLVDEAHSIFNEIPQKTNQITTTMVCLFVCFIKYKYYLMF
jgi:pentatricopeptide repeat protein